MIMATSNDGKGTGPKPASDAGKLLRNPKTPKKVKDVAASDLRRRRASRRRTVSDRHRPGPATRAANGDPVRRLRQGHHRAAAHDRLGTSLRSLAAELPASVLADLTGISIS